MALPETMNEFIPCMVKELLGVDCPLCGFQRSVVALLHGRIAESFSYYPALLPLIITGIILAIYCFSPKQVVLRIFKISLAIDIVIIFGFFFLKLFGVCCV